MSAERPYYRPELERADRATLERRQFTRLRDQLELLLTGNPFYRSRLEAAGLREAAALADLSSLRSLPCTRKAELAKDQRDHPPFGTNLTFPLERYTRLHQTSGTSGGRPIRWLDTAESWAWWAECWGYVYTAAGVGPGDRIFYAFSFGPFIGFWSAFEGARMVGAMTVPGGGQDSAQRLQTLFDTQATVLLSTPTYALRLAEVAVELGLDPRASAIRTTIHAGEPGASIPATRAQIDERWGATCFDHTGLTEVGATGFSCRERSGVHLIESEFIFEVIDPASGEPLPPGERGELVVTNLGRVGMPLLRYRTGDLVELDAEPCGCGRTFSRLRGGVLGRADDMLVVRGVNVFPSSLEDVIREFGEVAEFRLELNEVGALSELRLIVEPTPAADGAGLARRIGEALQRRLLLRIDCQPVAPGTLPRFELKARRLVRLGPGERGILEL